jgi:hypothetical protein
MVKKFTLSVSDDLAEKIEARRDYLGNLSAVFQEAVSEKIARKEARENLIKGDENMEETIERLRREKAEATKDNYEDGVRSGIEWSKNSNYRDLQYMLTFDPVATPYGDSCYFINDLTGDDTLGESFQQAFNDDPTMTADEQGILNELAEEWFRGWRQGVQEFWKQVKDKL